MRGSILSVCRDQSRFGIRRAVVYRKKMDPFFHLLVLRPSVNPGRTYHYSHLPGRSRSQWDRGPSATLPVSTPGNPSLSPHSNRNVFWSVCDVTVLKFNPAFLRWSRSRVPLDYGTPISSPKKSYTQTALRQLLPIRADGRSLLDYRSAFETGVPCLANGSARAGVVKGRWRGKWKRGGSYRRCEIGS